MRDKTHLEAIERWAGFIKKNPNEWKKIHTEFINSQYYMHERFLNNLLKQKNGAKKIIDLYNIKNLAGYEELLKIKKPNQKHSLKESYNKDTY